MYNIKTKKKPRNIISWANKVPQYKASSISNASSRSPILKTQSLKKSKNRVCSEFESGGEYYDFLLKKENGEDELYLRKLKCLYGKFEDATHDLDLYRKNMSKRDSVLVQWDKKRRESDHIRHLDKRIRKLCKTTYSTFCSLNEAKYQRLLTKYEKGTLSEKDKKLIDKWRNQEFKEGHKICTNLGHCASFTPVLEDIPHDFGVMYTDLKTVSLERVGNILSTVIVMNASYYASGWGMFRYFNLAQIDKDPSNNYIARNQNSCSCICNSLLFITILLITGYNSKNIFARLDTVKGHEHKATHWGVDLCYNMTSLLKSTESFLRSESANVSIGKKCVYDKDIYKRYTSDIIHYYDLAAYNIHKNSPEYAFFGKMLEMFSDSIEEYVNSQPCKYRGKIKNAL